MMLRKAMGVLTITLIALTGCATSPAAGPTATVQPTNAAQPTAAQPKPAAQGQQTTAATTPSGTLVAAISSFAEDTIDPILATVPAAPIVDPIFETLTAFDENGKLVPRLAESWSLSPDGKVWTIKVHKGIKFHNGDDMTSADFKFSIERMMSPKAVNNWTPVFRNEIASMDTPDPDTLIITTKDVDANFIYNMVGAAVMPKKYIEQNGEDYFAQHPVGTGPYKFVSHTPGASVDYEAVANHWRQPPAFQHLTVKLVPEEGTRIAMLKRGEIDVTEISLDSVDDVKAAGLELRYGIYDSQPLVLIPGTWINTGQSTMDIRVRHAMALAINRDEIAKTFFKGLATPATRRAMASYTWAWDPSWKPDPYDPQQARQLLAAAGYPDKFKDPVITAYSYKQAGAGWLDQFMQIVAGYWEAVGIQTRLTPIDAGTLRTMYMARPLDPKIVGAVYPFSGATSSNSIAIAWNGYGSTGIFGVMNDPQWDALYHNVLKELDEKKRIDLFREAMNKGHDNYIDTMVVNVKLVYAVGNKVGEWRGGYTSLGTAFPGMQHK